MAKDLSLGTLPKAQTGISGLDEITFGGLPQGRPTLLVGGAGSGKTMLAMEFLVRGTTEFEEPGVFLAFEETAPDLAANFASRGIALDDLIAQKKLYIDHVHVDRSEIEETGEYDLGGLFIRLDYAIRSIGAKRVVIDTLEALFSGFSNIAILRAELRRLFIWLKDRGVTAIITAERSDSGLTRYGIEEFVADCVILLDNRMAEQVATRRLRIVKYRGSRHGVNEYPFLIGDSGLSILPITSVGLKHEVSTERISSGIPRLDTMLGGSGYYRGSAVLVSGTAGTGKSTLAATFAHAVCRRGEKCLYFAFEESPSQIMRNMRSVGMDLKPLAESGLLVFHADRPSEVGLETHLTKMIRAIEESGATTIAVDPISTLSSAGNVNDAKSILIRLIDYLKSKHMTGLFTNLTVEAQFIEQTEVGVSSLMDTWIVLRDVERAGERNRELHILKSRGMPHSNQLREFVITDHGIELVDVYIGAAGVLTGTARVSQEAREQAETVTRQQEIARRKRDLERTRKMIGTQVEALQTDMENAEEELGRLLLEDQMRVTTLKNAESRMSSLRGADGELALQIPPNGR